MEAAPVSLVREFETYVLMTMATRMSMLGKEAVVKAKLRECRIRATAAQRSHLRVAGVSVMIRQRGSTS